MARCHREHVLPPSHRSQCPRPQPHPPLATVVLLPRTEIVDLVFPCVSRFTYVLVAWARPCLQRGSLSFTRASRCLCAFCRQSIPLVLLKLEFGVCTSHVRVHICWASSPGSHTIDLCSLQTNLDEHVHVPARRELGMGIFDPISKPLGLSLRALVAVRENSLPGRGEAAAGTFRRIRPPVVRHRRSGRCRPSCDKRLGRIDNPCISTAASPVRGS